MDSNAFYKKLVVVARKAPPSEAVPYAFEKRIMARVGSRLKLDAWALWSQSLWRAALMCGLVSIAMGAWCYTSISRDNSSQAVSLAFEKTVFAPIDQAVAGSW